jgi:hypothetical protein
MPFEINVPRSGKRSPRHGQEGDEEQKRSKGPIVDGGFAPVSCTRSNDGPGKQKKGRGKGIRLFDSSHVQLQAAGE